MPKVFSKSLRSLFLFKIHFFEKLVVMEILKKWEEMQKIKRFWCIFTSGLHEIITCQRKACISSPVSLLGIKLAKTQQSSFALILMQSRFIYIDFNLHFLSRLRWQRFFSFFWFFFSSAFVDDTYHLYWWTTKGFFWSRAALIFFLTLFFLTIGYSKKVLKAGKSSFCKGWASFYYLFLIGIEKSIKFIFFSY